MAGDSGTSAARVPPRLVLERACAIVCTLIGVFVGLGAESLVSASSSERSGTLPAHGALWIAGMVLGAASFAWAVQAFRRPETDTSDDVAPAREAVPVFALLMVGAYAAQWLGLLLAAGLTYLALMFFYRDKNKLFIFVSAVGYLVFLHYGMEVLLNVPLARSPIFYLPF